MFQTVFIMFLYRSAGICRPFQRLVSTKDYIPRVTQVVSFDAMNTLIAPKEPPAITYAHTARNMGIAVEEAKLKMVFPKLLSEQAAKHPCFGHNTIGPHKWWGEVIIRCIEKASGATVDGDLATSCVDELYAYFSRQEAWCIVDPDGNNCKKKEQIEGRNVQIKPVLTRLRQRGFALAVVSNFDCRLRSLLEQFSLSSMFDVMLLSGELGIEKPDPRIFEKLVRHFDLQSHKELLHIGDHVRKDFLGARDFGAKALLFDPFLKEDSIPTRDKIVKFNQLSIY